MSTMMDNVPANAAPMLQSPVVPSGTTPINGPSTTHSSPTSSEATIHSSSINIQPLLASSMTSNASSEPIIINETTPSSTTSSSMEIDQTSAVPPPTLSQNSTKSFPSPSATENAQSNYPQIVHNKRAPGYLAEKSNPNLMFGTVVAPVPASISINSQPISTIQTSINYSHPPLNDGAGKNTTTESKEEVEAKIVEQNRPKSTNPTSFQLAAEIVNKTRQLYLRTLSTTSSSTTTSSPLHENICHCLVVDEGKFKDDPVNMEIYKQILKLNNKPDLVLEQVQKWLKQDALFGTACCLGKGGQTKLHIQFESYEHLASGLQLYPFLVRCGALGAVAWNTKPCGLDRRECPEMLQFEFTPSSEHPKSTLMNEVQQLLLKMQLNYYALWFRPESSNQRSIIFHVLPRNIGTLGDDINRIHLQYSLWGGKIRVHCPKSKQFTRCRQCEQLGHETHECPLYTGFAIRLLTKQPTPFLTFRKWLALSGAQSGYLGSSLEERKPNRRITLLYKNPLTELDANAITTQLASLVEHVADCLFQEPCTVETSIRHRECDLCGSVMKPHFDCPFADQLHRSNPTSTLAHRSAISNSESTRLGKGRPNTNPASSSSTVSTSSTICRSWERTHQCPRLEKHQICSFQHPPDHQLISKPALKNICFSFDKNGHCDRGTTCPYAQFHVPSASRQVSDGVAAGVGTNVSVSAPAPVQSSFSLQPPAIQQPTPNQAVSASIQPISNSSQPTSSTTTIIAPSNEITNLPNNGFTQVAPKRTKNGRATTKRKVNNKEDETSLLDANSMDVPNEEQKEENSSNSNKKRKKITPNELVDALTQNPNSWAAISMTEDDEVSENELDAAIEAISTPTTNTSSSATTARPTAPRSSLDSIGSPNRGRPTTQPINNASPVRATSMTRARPPPQVAAAASSSKQ